MSRFLGDLPRLFPRPEQTIAGIGRMLRNGEVSCLDIVGACLEQVDEWEPRVHAWVVIDREGAMRQARTLDEELRSGKDRGPLHGIPIGIKDIIDVDRMPTACGTNHRGRKSAEKDARVVERLRQAGAVVMGKTVTTPHAWIDPPPTRNPWNLGRTPGGSSSGSAAAVASGMCYAAIGTQTGGSITRPASFCGVAGMKPSQLGIWTLGVSPLAPSLDHVGPIARTAGDLQAIFSVMVEEYFPGDKDGMMRAIGAGRPRLVRLRGYFDHRANPAVRSAFEGAIRMLIAHGAEVVDLDDPLDFESVLQDHRLVLAAEAAAVHSGTLEMNPEDYPPRIRELIIEGRSIQAVDYILSRDRMGIASCRIGSMIEESEVQCVVTPATVGTAPDPSTTGDPAFNSPWSYTHSPTVSIPVTLADDGMPVAIQLVGPLLADNPLLSVARWCEHAIQTWHQ